MLWELLLSTCRCRRRAFRARRAIVQITNHLAFRPEERGDRDLAILERLLLRASFMQQMTAEALRGIAQVCFVPPVRTARRMPRRGRHCTSMHVSCCASPCVCSASVEPKRKRERLPCKQT